MEYCFDTDLGYLRCSFYTDRDGYLIMSDALLNDKLDIKASLSDATIDRITNEADEWITQNPEEY